MGTLCQDYSGVVIDQNAASSGSYAWRDNGGQIIYQTFALPSDYGRGTTDTRYPDLSGFQVLVSVEEGAAATASLVARIDYNDGSGWTNVAAGVITGAPNDGPYVWFNCILSDSVPVTAKMAAAQWRIGISLPLNTAGINSIAYVTPAATVGTATLYSGDPLAGTTASLNFRVLALQADSGTDFIGNEYRGVVAAAVNGNIQTTEGTNPVDGAGSAPYWLSQMLPSPSAVEALYFDVRPVTSTVQYGLINQIANPSFAYDELDDEPAWWTIASGGATVSDAWSPTGGQSLLMDAAAINSVETPMPGTINGLQASLAYSAVVKLAASSSVTLSVTFYDTNDTLISTVTAGTTSAVGVNPVGGVISVPTNSVSATFNIISTGTVAIGAIQGTFTATIQTYFDGDSSGAEWLGQKGNSESGQLLFIGPSDDYVVIDSVLVDPLIPGMSFNVYYTTDDSYTSTNMEQADWDSKLWTRIQSIYDATGRQQYAFPSPIIAKYMKIEFTNPQAQSYNPGEFQVPVPYQQFPTWVTNYFGATSSSSSLTAAGIVNVQYDALSLAYIPYTDDLIQSPTQPVATPTAAQTNTDLYWSNGISQNADTTTLGQISLNMNPYQQPVGANADSTTVVGAIGNAVAIASVSGSSTAVAVVESTSSTNSTITAVSSSYRDDVLAQQTAPDMYFYLPCRHAYKQSTAKFDYNRGYQFGVNSVAFMRNDYTVSADTEQYIETGGDSQNTNLNDFNVTSEGWFTYAQ